MLDWEQFLTRQTNHILKESLKESLDSKKPRKEFSQSVKNQVLVIQNHRCNYCYRAPDVVNFDHIDGNRENNLFYNCQALCPNCHAKKTRRKV